jgi:hypothetical protein
MQVDCPAKLIHLTLLRLSVLAIENYKCFFTFCLSIPAAGIVQVISMRGPPCLDNLPYMA